MEQGELIFGTDGVRDRAGEGLLAPGEVARLVQASAFTLREPERFPRDYPVSAGRSRRRAILIGRDTRESGPVLSGVIQETFRRAGFPVVDLGVLPTPGVARLASEDPAALLGVVVSASHNPAEYNGIKFLAPTGAKASPELEQAVSDAFWKMSAVPGGPPAALRTDPDSVKRYAASLASLCRRPERLRGLRVVLDTAHGATFEAAPRVFRSLGAEVTALGDRPDGRNINTGCGALHPEALARAVADSGASLGFSFDGDGDRMIPVAGGGTVLDGDHVLMIAGRSLRREGRLPRRAVVATVMSNLGLEKALAADGIGLLRTAVGDRHVYEAMVEGGHPLGGEQSGHLIFIDDARTGDGILAALRLLDCLGEGPPDLAAEAKDMTRYPQVLLNYPVARKVPFEELPRVTEALARAEASLGGEGRVLLRYSGTEPLARVMIEGPERGAIEKLAREIGEAIVGSIRG